MQMCTIIIIIIIIIIITCRYSGKYPYFSDCFKTQIFDFSGVFYIVGGLD